MKTAILVLCCGILGACLGSGLAILQVGWASADATNRLIDARQPALPRPGEASPKVQVDNETYDFGAMERGTTMSHEFVFTNVGEGRMKLTVGDTTCKCTLGEVSKDLIEPGQSTSVRLEWIANTQSNEFRQSATIFTNDPHRSRITLTVQGLVSRLTSISPPDLHFGKVPLGQTRTAEVFVLSHHVDHFEILKHEFVGIDMDESLETSIERAVRDELPDRLAKSGYRVRVTVKETTPFGILKGWLRLKTDLEKVEQIDIPFSVRIVSDISIFGKGYNAEKAILRLGAIRSNVGKTARLLVLVRGDDAKETTLRVADVSPDFLVVELGEPKMSQVVQIPLTVRVPAGSPAAVFVGGTARKLGRIVLETSHPNVPRLEIGLLFSVEE